MDIEIPWDVPASLLEGVSVFSNLHPSIHSSIRLFNHPSIPPSLCQSIRPSFLSGTLPMEVYKKRSTSLSFLRSLIQRFVYSFIESYLTTFWTFVQVPHNRILLIAQILSPQLFITCSGRKTVNIFHVFGHRLSGFPGRIRSRCKITHIVVGYDQFDRGRMKSLRVK